MVLIDTSYDRYLSKTVLCGHPVLSGHCSIPRGCPLNTGFTVYQKWPIGKNVASGHRNGQGSCPVSFFFSFRSGSFSTAQVVPLTVRISPFPYIFYCNFTFMTCFIYEIQILCQPLSLVIHTYICLFLSRPTRVSRSFILSFFFFFQFLAQFFKNREGPSE